MLKRFTQTYSERLLELIKQSDSTKLAKLLNQSKLRAVSEAELETLLGALLTRNDAKMLALFLSCLGEEIAAQQNLWLQQVVTHCASPLPMVTALLNAKVPNKDLSIVDTCFAHLPQEEWLMIVSRLAEYGLDIAQHPSALDTALANNHQSLVHYLIESGCPLAKEPPEERTAEIWAYAKRCADDKAVRAMLGP